MDTDRTLLATIGRAQPGKKAPASNGANEHRLTRPVDCRSVHLERLDGEADGPKARPALEGKFIADDRHLGVIFAFF